MSQSYTILPFINPPAGAYDSLNAVASLNNNFTVPQSFNGIVNSGSESCASLAVSGASTFTGVCTFNAIPQFNAGINIAIAEVDTGTLSVTGASSLNGGVTVLGAVSLPASSVVQSFVSSGYVDLVNAQTVAGVKTLSSPPVMSGASISANSVPALSIVNKSLGDAQLTLSGVGQTSVASGYVDLVNAQTVAGVKTFSSPPAMSGASITIASMPGSSIANNSINGGQIALGGIAQANVSNGYVDLTSNQTIVGTKSFSSPLIVNSTTTVNNTATFNGSMIASAIGASTITAGGLVTCNAGLTVATGTLTCGTLSCTSEIDSGAGSFGGLLSANAGLNVPSGQNATLNGGLVLPVAQTSLSIVAGSVAVNLNNLSFNEFILPSANFTANITAMTFTNVIVNAKFNIYIIGGVAAHNINKNLNSGAVSQVNTLTGNTSVAANTVWRCSGTVLSSTLVALDFQNYT